MQSILLATPSKTSKLEIRHDNKLSNEGTNVQGKDGSKKSANGFASVLEKTALDSKGIENKELESKKSESKDSEDKSSEGKELQAKVSKKETLEKTKETKNGASLNNELVSKTLPNEEKTQKGKIDPLLLEKNQVSESSIKTVKSDQSTSLANGVDHLENTDSTVIADSSKEKFNNALSANNKQTEKSELDSPIIAPMESDNAEKMTKANYVLNAKEDSNFSEKLSKDETFTDKEVTAEINDLSTGRANTEAMNSGKDITALDNINLNENREKLDPVSTTNTFASVSSSTINNVKNRLGEISEDKENSMEKVLSPEEAPELEALGEGNTSKSLDDSSDASDKAVESEQENKLLEDINISELAEEIEPVDLQNILRNEDTQNLSEQTQQFKGINTENVVANNKFSEEIIDADINSIDSEIINLTTSIVDVESLKEVSQSEEDNDEEVTVQALTDSDLEIQDPIVNPILAQIQAAQKTDTKVTDNELQSSAGIGNIEKGNKKNGLSLSKDVSKDSIKVDKNNIENVLADASEKSTLLEKDLINKANISANEKLEGMLANFKAEAAKPFFNQNNESSSLNSLGTASANADKLLHQTQTNATNPTLQSSALKQPLELQAKHASAMVGERIMMMINQGKQEVTIRLDPAELGSMHIKLHVQQDQLQVAIQTQVGQSRDIIEQNLPRLREQLAQQGINLGEASVEQQGKQQQSNSQDSSQMGRSAQGTGGQGESFVEEQSEFFPTQIPLPAQGIDYYA